MDGSPRVLASLCLGAALLTFGCDASDSLAGGGSQAGGDLGDLGDLGDMGDLGDTTGQGDETGEADTDNGTVPGEDGCDVPSPYMGGWDIGCCQADVGASNWSPGGVGPGSVLPDWTFTDQFGDAVAIHDFCHDAIYFEYAAIWCGSCQAHAPEIANLYNTYEGRGLMTLTYMSEGKNGGPASQADVVAWSTTYAQAGLVVFSGLEDVWYPFATDAGGGSFSISLPGTMLVGPGAKIAKLGIPTIQEIELVLPGQ